MLAKSLLGSQWIEWMGDVRDCGAYRGAKSDGAEGGGA